MTTKKNEAKTDVLDQRARAAFFGSNPGASEDAYNTIAGELKQQLQLSDAVEADRRIQGQLHSIYSEF